MIIICFFSPVSLGKMAHDLMSLNGQDDFAGKGWAKNNNRPPWRFHDYSADIN